MIRVHDAQVLRSIINEGGRQADFYSRQNNDTVATFWSELESLAFSAKQDGHVLLIEKRGSTSKNPLIKLGE